VRRRPGAGQGGPAEADVGRAAAGPERLSAGLAVKRLFAKAALDHVPPSTASPLPRRDRPTFSHYSQVGPGGRKIRNYGQKITGDSSRFSLPFAGRGAYYLA